MECVYSPELRNDWFWETHSPGLGACPPGTARHPRSRWAPQWQGGRKDSFPRQFHFHQHRDLRGGMRFSFFLHSLNF